VPAHQRWMNHRRFDGGQLQPAERELRDFYKRLLNFIISSSALMGEYRDIHYHNRENTENYNNKVLSFARWSEDEKVLVTSNFDDRQAYSFNLKLPSEVIDEWHLEDGVYQLQEMLYGGQTYTLRVEGGSGSVDLKLEPLGSLILQFKDKIDE
jgi:hypothetical protein